MHLPRATLLSLLVVWPVAAATPQEGAPAPAGAESATSRPDELEQLVAPIALYPDGLLAQVLMAATYPLEIVQAARWLEKHPGLAPEALEAALQQETWDPSVKSLCGFPEVLRRMNANLDWTQDLGDAFLADQSQVMDAVQTMRRKAYEAGTLESSEEQTVTELEGQVLVVEPASPEVVYVPTYYPSAVYGSWAPPVYYYPPMYPPPPAGGMFFGFTAGVVWGAAIWGDCDWGHTEVDIDIDRYNTFVDRTEVDHRRTEVQAQAQGGEWKHEPEHRQGVAYQDREVAQRYGASSGETRVPRDQARGYGERSSTRPATSGDRAAERPATSGDRAAAGTRERTAPRPGAESRPAPRSSGQSSSSFSGARNPSLDRAGSARGASSRAASRGSSGGGRGGGRRG